MKKIHLFTALAVCTISAASAQNNEDLARWVEPFVGTEAEGNCFPGPCCPFGLVQPSPDTGKKVTCGGYKFYDKTIRGFSQTHLNGTGRPGMGDIAVLPLCNEQMDVYGEQREMAFDKSSEVAEVGYYAVTLENGVRCEATATERVAVWRFTWPKDGTKKSFSARRIFLDAAAMLMQGFNAKFGESVFEATHVLSSDKRRIQGYKKARGWTPYKLFYAIEFSEPWKEIKRFASDPFQSAGDRWVLDFDAAGCSRGSAAGSCQACPLRSSGSSLEIRIALSTVSEAGALANLRAEAHGKTFDDIRAECRASWNEIFSRAQLVKGTDDQKKNWYTALYHLCIQPNIQSDVDGKYRGSDDKIRVAKRGHYSTFSLWDTYRAAHPLYTILTPERVPGFIDSLIAFGREHGHLPMWTMWQQDGHDMIGIHSIPVIVDACKKGLWNPQTIAKGNEKAHDLLTLLVQSMINNDGENPKNCWNAYWENGYIPYYPGEFDEFVPKAHSVSITLELAYNWWCIADFARFIGDNRSAANAMKWADCWKNVFDKETGFVRARAPKTAGGKWREPFDPVKSRVDGVFWCDYTEANAWIYTWHVFQDVDALAEALGGREKSIAKLDEFFTTMPLGAKHMFDEGGLLKDGSLRDGQIGQYWHGNEPSHHIVYLYSLWGRRDKTAALVKRICRDSYRPRPDGLCGNDDCGQMSAWYLFSMMGFYPVNPCDDGYVLGAMQAEEIKLKVRGVKDNSENVFTIRNTGKGTVMLNGKRVPGVKILHSDVISGGTLLF